MYELRACVVMPNDVHLLIRRNVAAPVITRWLKGSTAHAANQLLGRKGRFWQNESFHRSVRTDSEFNRMARYIEWNPVSAGLVEFPELWRYSSASWQAKPPARRDVLLHTSCAEKNSPLPQLAFETQPARVGSRAGIFGRLAITVTVTIRFKRRR
ncbi:MAG TPA: transposase [Bryobacteraceae bacterium]|nr:transposase [Bryobacteraceae bacterium]